MAPASLPLRSSIQQTICKRMSSKAIGAGGRSSSSGITATVFGASGFLGRYVTNKLGGVGSQVFVASRSGEMHLRHLKLMGDLGQIVPLDVSLKDEASIRKAVGRSDVVINCIGKNWDTRNYTLEDVNIRYAAKLAEISKDMGVETFINVSALGASEDAPSRILQTKKAGEAAVRAAFPETVTVRPALMIGPEDKSLNWNAMVYRQLGVSPIFFNGSTTQRPIFVGDVATSILSICENTEMYSGKIVELFGPEKHTQESMVALVQEIAEFQANNITLNEPLSKLFGKITDYIPDHFVLGDFSSDRILLYSHSIEPSGEEGVLTPADIGLATRKIETVGRTWLQMWNRGSPFITGIPEDQQIR